MALNYQLLSVNDASQVAEARRLATTLAARQNFTETEIGKIAIVVTEATTNLLKHAGNGLLKLRLLEDQHQPGLEILVLDQGPGMQNIEQCLSDGYSTGSSPGTGLGAIIRLSTLSDIYSLPNRGAALLAQFWPEGSHKSQKQIEVGVVTVAKSGEQSCGDGWCASEQAGQCRLMVVDGLGHGPSAEEAANQAIKLFLEHSYLSPKPLIEKIHLGLRATRGAALAIAQLDLSQLTVTYAGLGNISGRIISPTGLRSMVSYNGTAGHSLTSLQEFSYPWSLDSLLIMHSDGIGTQWQLDNYPGLVTHHPSLIAGVLFRDYNRGHDDATVLVAKPNR